MVERYAHSLVTLAGKQLDVLEATDLQSLVINGVAEGRTVEFKKSVGTNDAARKEFLADVSSFANASGGDILVGVEAKSGIASALPGIPTDEADAEILRLENLIRDGIDPRIPGLAIRPVRTETGQAVLVIRIPRSYGAPHMVTLQNTSRFYTRNSAGKHQLDVGEIRSAFALSETARSALRTFRLERLGRITANDGALPLLPNPKTVLHVIPLTAFDSSGQVDTASLTRNHSPEFQPLYGGGWSTRINFDGAVAFSQTREEGQAASYTQVFRSGAIEGVEALMLRDRESGRHLIPSIALEKTIIGSFALYLALLNQLAVSPPIFVALTLLDVRGMEMAVDPSRHFYDATTIDRDDLVVPEIVVESFDVDPARTLRPAFDAIWNATGWPGSLSYDEAGEWSER